MAALTFAEATALFDSAIASAKTAQTKIGNVKKTGRQITVNAISAKGSPAELVTLAKKGANLRRQSAAGDESAKDLTGAAAMSSVRAMYAIIGVDVDESAVN